MCKPFLTGYKRHNPPGCKILNFSIFLFLCFCFCLHYIISTQTTYLNKKLRTLRRFTKPESDFRFVQFFFYTPCITNLSNLLFPVLYLFYAWVSAIIFLSFCWKREYCRNWWWFQFSAFFTKSRDDFSFIFVAIWAEVLAADKRVSFAAWVFPAYILQPNTPQWPNTQSKKSTRKKESTCMGIHEWKVLERV